MTTSLVGQEILDFSGEWIGAFGVGHGGFDQVVQITQESDRITAVKITGSEHVPAGEVAFRADIRTLEGEGQIAEPEFRNPRFVPGYLRIINTDHFVFHWENCGGVEFRRDD